ncbi:transposase [Sphingomonas glacialis]|uniref:transposase n=1 Tax=Sphingomonas glacialis TaxID=658225 RepID=UPI0019D6A0B9|nr:transposase [Sphingomonas glacialis]
MRGVALITAVTLVVEIGDVMRFDTAPQLMAYLPSLITGLASPKPFSNTSNFDLDVAIPTKIG